MLCEEHARAVIYSACGHSVACVMCNKRILSQPRPACALCRAPILPGAWRVSVPATFQKEEVCQVARAAALAAAAGRMDDAFLQSSDEEEEEEEDEEDLENTLAHWRSNDSWEELCLQVPNGSDHDEVLWEALEMALSTEQGLQAVSLAGRFRPCRFDYARALRAAARNPSVQSFTVQGGDEASVAALLRELRTSSLQNLLLRRCQLTGDAAEQLCAALACNAALLRLDLDGCSAACAVRAVNSLFSNARLQRMGLQRLSSGQDLAALRDALEDAAETRGFPLLVDLRNNGLESADRAALFEGILPPGCGWRLLLTDSRCVHPPI